MNPVESWLSRLSENSRETARGSLKRSASVIFGENQQQWEKVTIADISRLISHLSQTKKPSTVAKELSFVKEVIRECWRLGMKTREDLERAISFKWRMYAGPASGRHLHKQERRKIIDTIGLGNQGLRDRALVRMMALGLRRNEIAVAKISDFQGDFTSISVCGKGKRMRNIPISEAAAEDFRRYMRVRGSLPGYFIVATNYGALCSGKVPISTRAINKIITRIARQSGVNFTPHDMRRSAIGDWLGSVDVSVAMKMAGHSSPQTTVRYDHRKIDEHSRQAINASDF